MNLHTIHGRLVRDPELTSGSDQTKDRVKFTVAVDRRFGDEADFFDCILFGKRAQVISKWFCKGQEILVQGEGQLNKWQTRDGQNRVSYSIVVQEFDFCGSKEKTGGTAPAAAPVPDSMEKAEEDIPF